MRREGEVKISDLTAPLHFLEQLSHPGRENALQCWKRSGIAYGLVLFLCFPPPGCIAEYYSVPQKVRETLLILM